MKITCVLIILYLTANAESLAVLSKEQRGLSAKSEAEDDKIAALCKDSGVQLRSHFCSCVNNVCSCCVDVIDDALRLDDTLCVNFAYLPQNYEVGLNVTWDGKVIISSEISGKNPPPICAKIPVPHLSSALSLCLRLQNVSISSHFFESCVSVELKLLILKILEANLGCITLGHKNQDWMCTYMNEHRSQPRIPSCVNSCHESIDFLDTKVFKPQSEREKMEQTYFRNGCYYMKGGPEKGKDKTDSNLCIVGCAPNGYMD